MAISQVRAVVAGTAVTLTYNSATGKYEGSLVAPNQTSYHQPGGAYPITVEATNTAGTQTTATAKLVVKETIAPIITVQSPTAGACLAGNQPAIQFTVLDEAGGSGVASITLTLDGQALAFAQTAITNGYSCTATPPVLADGAHTIEVEATDQDGNQATRQTRAFTVDTIPPVLSITSPADGLITPLAVCTLAGITNDATSGLAAITITLNGADVGEISVGADGAFVKALTLAEGENTILATATDRAGRTSQVSRRVLLDTDVPQITSIALAPDAATAGELVQIKVTVV